MVTVLSNSQDWYQMKGIQIEGGVRLVDSRREFVSCTSRLPGKFPGLGREAYKALQMRFHKFEGKKC